MMAGLQRTYTAFWVMILVALATGRFLHPQDSHAIPDHAPLKVERITFDVAPSRALKAVASLNGAQGPSRPQQQHGAGSKSSAQPASAAANNATTTGTNTKAVENTTALQLAVPAKPTAGATPTAPVQKVASNGKDSPAAQQPKAAVPNGKDSPAAEQPKAAAPNGKDSPAAEQPKAAAPNGKDSPAAEQPKAAAPNGKDSPAAQQPKAAASNGKDSPAAQQPSADKAAPWDFEVKPSEPAGPLSTCAWEPMTRGVKWNKGCTNTRIGGTCHGIVLPGPPFCSGKGGSIASIKCLSDGDWGNVTTLC